LLAYGVTTAIAISDDGSTIGIAVASNTSSPKNHAAPTSQFHILNAQAGKVMAIYDLGTNVAVSEMSVSITRDGSLIAFTNTPVVYVLTSAGKLHTPAMTMPNSAPVQICPLGIYLTTGDDNAQIYRWNTTSLAYDSWQEIAVTGWYFWTSVMSMNGGGPNDCMAAFGYSNLDVTQLRVDVYLMYTGQLYMSWVSPLNVAGQTMPTLSFHMNYLGVASWGDENGGVPQILLFDVTSTTSSTPIFTYQTPGSMFAIEIEVANAAFPPMAVNASTDTINLIACGKHVHASSFGNGGDAFAFQLQAP